MALLMTPQLQAGNGDGSKRSAKDGFTNSSPRPSQLIAGEWEHISYTDNKNNREIPLGMIGITITTQFMSNGTYTITTNSDSGPKTEAGKWSFNEERQIITMSMEKGEDALEYQIKKLDEQSMIIEVKNRTTKMRKLGL